MIGAAAIALGLRLGGTALWLLFSIIVARALSVEDFGLVFFTINLTFLGAAFAGLGYPAACLRFASQYWDAGKRAQFRALLKEARSAVVLTSAVVLIGFVLAAVFGLETPATSNLWIALLAGLGIAATAVMAVHRDMLRGADRMRAALMGQSLIRAVVPLLLLPVLWLAGGLTAHRLIVAYLLGLCVALAWEIWQLRRLDLPAGGQGERSHLPVALGIWPGEAALILNHRAAGILIALTGGLSAAGVFLAAERIAQLGQFLTDAVRTVIGPMLAQADATNRQEAVSKASALMAVAGGLGGLGVALVGLGVLVAFGEAYRSAMPVMLILVLAQSSTVVFGPVVMILNMSGQERIFSTTMVVATASLIGLLLLCSTPIQAALAILAVSWAMNGALCLAIRWRLQVLSGVFGISRADLLDLGQQVKDLRDKLPQRSGA